MRILDPKKLNPIVWEYMPDNAAKDSLRALQIETQVGPGFDFDSEQEEAAESKFTKLIKLYELQNWETELIAFRVYLHRVFPFNTAAYDFSMSKPDFKSYSNEVRQLKEFNAKSGLLNLKQVAFTFGKGKVLRIKHPKLIEELLSSLNILSSCIEELPIPIDAFPETKYVTSHGKSYTEYFLFPFYQFISTKVLPDLTKKGCYLFIAAFTCTIDVDWSLIRDEGGQLLEDYLENIFKKLA